MTKLKHLTCNIYSLSNQIVFCDLQMHLQVHNHFSKPVQIYRKKRNSDENIYVGEVAARTVMHVPLHAIYSERKDLHFAINVRYDWLFCRFGPTF